MGCRSSVGERGAECKFIRFAEILCAPPGIFLSTSAAKFWGGFLTAGFGRWAQWGEEIIGHDCEFLFARVTSRVDYILCIFTFLGEASAL